MSHLNAYDFSGMPLQDLPGIAFGYSTHSKMLRKHLELLGVGHSTESPVAVSILSANLFRPVPNKFNVLFTMYECEDIPESWIAPLNTADLIVVPCYQNLLLFRKYTDKPIEVDWEGTETDLFSYVDRSFPKPGERFQFLWVGAPNPRKGWEATSAAYDLLRDQHPDLQDKIQLYMKTTNIGEAGSFQEFHDGEIIVDKRVLPREDLAALYQKAHCFLLPTQGEGFGLTLAEALATGCPSVHTPYGGTADFANYDISYQLQWVFGASETFHMGPGGDLVKDLDTKVAKPHVEDIAQWMYHVYTHYEDALARGKLAAARMKERFDWKHSAARFKDIIEHHYALAHPEPVDVPLDVMPKFHPSIQMAPGELAGGTLLFLPTMRCNLSCDYCYLEHKKEGEGYSWKYFDTGHTVAHEVGLEEALAAVRKLRPALVEFTGGEPLLWPHFVEFVKQLPEGTSWAITSNTLLLTPELADAIDFSRCLSWTASDHGCYGPFTSAVTRLRARGVPTSVTIVAEAVWCDCDALKTKIDILEPLGARINLLFERNEGVDWTANPSYEGIRSYASARGLNVVDGPTSYAFPTGFVCKGGQRYFALGPDGNMFRCFTELMMDKNSLGPWNDFATFPAPTLCDDHCCYLCALDEKSIVSPSKSRSARR